MTPLQGPGLAELLHHRPDVNGVGIAAQITDLAISAA